LEWAEVLKVLIGYGVTGIITFLFIKEKIMNSDKQLKLMEKISERMESVGNLLVNLKQDIDGVGNVIRASTLQTLEVLYDEKTLNPSTFFHYADALNLKYIYKSISQAMSEIDENGFDDPSRLSMLKENVINTLKRSKDDFKSDIMEMEYNSSKLVDFDSGYTLIFTSFIEELREDILNPVNYDDIKDDKNYAIFKNKLRNKIWEFSRDTTGLLKSISKTY